MTDRPANDDEPHDYAYGEFGGTFAEFIEALREGGAEVETGIIVDGEFVKRAND